MGVGGWDVRVVSADSPPTETTNPLRARSGAGWRVTSRAAARRAAPSSSRTDRCRSARRSAARWRQDVRRFWSSPASVDDGVGQRRGLPARDDQRRRRPSVSTSCRPSASVETIGFPIASASNAVSGVPSHSDGNTTRSNADSASATSLRNPRSSTLSRDAAPRGDGLELSLQLAFADDVAAGVGKPFDDRAASPESGTRCPSTASGA